MGGCVALSKPFGEVGFAAAVDVMLAQEWELCFRHPSQAEKTGCVPSCTHFAVAGMQLPPYAAKHHLDAI